jgi:hypothetical protein
MKPILLVAIAFSTTSCFAQQSQAPCFNVPVTLSGNTTKEVSVTADATKSSTNCTYVYYHRRRNHKRPLADMYSGLTDTHASTPILLSTKKDMQPRTQSYKVTVNSPDATVTACPDSTLNLQANISVEQESEFTGFYPIENKNYKLVSRRVYMKTKRKMCKAMRDENKVARLTATRDM